MSLLLLWSLPLMAIVVIVVDVIVHCSLFIVGCWLLLIVADVIVGCWLLVVIVLLV